MGNIVVNPIQFFSDLAGAPLQDGSIYFGTANANPVTTPVTVYQDAALTIPLVQPIKITAGVPTIAGTPTPVYLSAQTCSLLLTDRKGRTILSLPSVSNPLAIALSLVAQIPFVVTSISALRNLTKGIYNQSFVEGYYAAGDGGGGLYYYDSSDNTSADNGGTIIVATDGGRWKLATTDSINWNQFGAKGDGTTLDDGAILNAISAGAYRGLPGKTYKISNYTIITGSAQLFTGGGNLLYNGTTLPVGAVTSAITLPVPSVFATIQDAVNFLETKWFEENGSAQIKVANGTYTGLSEISPTIAQGERVQILGDTSGTSPPAVTLSFNSTGNNQCGFKLYNGYQLDLIDGFYIQGNANTSTGVWAAQSYGAGIMAVNSGRARVGANVQVNQFYYGLSARYNGTLECEGAVQVFRAGDCGFHAFAGGSINAQRCKAFLCSDTGAGLGFGFCAEAGGFIDCSNGDSANNNKDGFYALNGGSMWAHSATANNNGGNGFHALEGGSIEVIPPPGGAQPNSYSNTGWGYYAEMGGKMNCNSCLANQNTAGGFGCVEKSAMDVTAASATNNTGDGFYCEGGSHMEGNPVNSYNNGGIGMHVLNGSSASFSGGTINQNTGGGLWAQQSSTINAPNASVIQSGSHGVLAQDCSSILGNNITSNQAKNSGNGFHISTCSAFRGTSPSANNNAGWGFYAENLAFAVATSGGGTGNTAGFSSPTQNAGAGNNGAYIQM